MRRNGRLLSKSSTRRKTLRKPRLKPSLLKRDRLRTRSSSACRNSMLLHLLPLLLPESKETREALLLLLQANSVVAAAEDAVEEEVDKNVPLALKAALLLSLVLPVVDLKEVDVEEEAEEEVDLLAADLIEDVEEVVDKEPLVVALAKEPPSPSMTSMLSPSWAASKFLLKRHFRMMGFLQSFDVVL